MSDDAPVTLLILGAGGDLTHRLLLPGIGSLLKCEPQRKVQIVGADRMAKSSEEWKALVKDSFSTVPVPARTAKSVMSKTRYQQTNVLDEDELRSLIESCSGPLVIYFALPPAITMQVCTVLEAIDLPNPTRLALEKPFGTDEKTAHSFNRRLHKLVPEDHIFRVDHFLGVSTVLNLIGLRFANRILQPIWNSEHIERVEIIYDEDLALEGRAGYYDTNGALKDMLQSHLLQVLSVFAMESIAEVSANELQDQKAQVLRATRLWGNSPKRSSRRARYTAGQIGSRKIPAYVKEQGVDPSRMTETLAEITVEIDNNRWSGVPFILRSGKAMGEPRKQIVAHFRDVPHLPTGFKTAGLPDQLIIDLKPGAVSLVLTMNAEGDPMDLERKVLRAELADGLMLPYGEVLRYLLDGNPMLCVRGDAAESCWRIMEPVLKAWKANRVPMEEYPAGSDGPDGWLPAS
ncbi:glucose-6-phosphate dehydrogenase [Rudaeicoccus suwonensis]|uniref:Glucose-6-phosphate 1-dehydrogenase n=1 Tax=Rudaeicoccus suwonensis TaxID=657409 RepID=A0A561E3K2_9MICO|nr:glucose-6-phosphate dehydrogenase [Rudaeicoccus suwonensis]TWE10195.1 glucose-6-phosphate 1-dehydrogenase [Rudaeicoccus suwonensis]